MTNSMNFEIEHDVHDNNMIPSFYIFMISFMFDVFDHCQSNLNFLRKLFMSLEICQRFKRNKNHMPGQLTRVQKQCRTTMVCVADKTEKTCKKLMLLPDTGTKSRLNFKRTSALTNDGMW